MGAHPGQFIALQAYPSAQGATFVILVDLFLSELTHGQFQYCLASRLVRSNQYRELSK